MGLPTADQPVNPVAPLLAKPLRQYRWFVGRKPGEPSGQRAPRNTRSVVLPLCDWFDPGLMAFFLLVSFLRDGLRATSQENHALLLFEQERGHYSAGLLLPCA